MDAHHTVIIAEFGLVAWLEVDGSDMQRHGQRQW